MFAPRLAAPLRTVGPAAIAKNVITKTRVMAPVGTRILSTSQSNQKEVTVAPLIEQRKNRPLSPHMTIYQPQLTWYMSGFHRFTGGALAVGFYGGAIAYAVAPMVGLGFDTATITSTIATLPVAAKVLGKLVIAFPFTFHSFNGMRHLLWDTTKGLTLKGVYTTGYTVLGLSTVSALALALI
ncbi:cytochrome b subunit of succinate dehydrogenase, Sdh3p [Lobosporangium transversale]|uniref:Succinate dehydrogenase cytochrome b560 subunit n=1 Tax=Lobosporangium transversale TaxID=64571 RepID=A0A1Y2GAB8_9FUNG|nr:succinate dehydrogenase cytochrome b560 subunit [Lobosporangium transversale]KAF9914564.1 cytochrome b subunit of succinate dehydrogenase, Sdh3p [Lobosporangium transversale]ORZ05352.1 succinate dehydrogenase cytochrome b560 subunit [Lobosporangium transversale]|eukprot:XP_021877044.1 succinate dehydrogenase cytochrome b560 subunit [Lobosporangium transversale]